MGGTCLCRAKFDLCLTTKLIIHDTYSVFSLISVTLCIDQRLEERSSQRVKGVVEARQRWRCKGRTLLSTFFQKSVIFLIFSEKHNPVFPHYVIRNCQCRPPVVPHLLFCLCFNRLSECVRGFFLTVLPRFIHSSFCDIHMPLLRNKKCQIR